MYYDFNNHTLVTPGLLRTVYGTSDFSEEVLNKLGLYKVSEDKRKFVDGSSVRVRTTYSQSGNQAVEHKTVEVIPRQEISALRLFSPNGSIFQITVDDNGNLSTTSSS